MGADTSHPNGAARPPLFQSLSFMGFWSTTAPRYRPPITVQRVPTSSTTSDPLHTVSPARPPILFIRAGAMRYYFSFRSICPVVSSSARCTSAQVDSGKRWRC